MLIGRVRLAPGKPGYYDDITGIHLTILRPEANIYSGMNTTNLKKSVAYGTLRLVYGTLEESSISKPISSPSPVVEVTPAPKEEVPVEVHENKEVIEVKKDEPEETPTKKKAAAPKTKKKNEKEEKTEE